MPLPEEFARRRVPPITMGWARDPSAPAIILHGTADQQAQSLPRVIDGTDRHRQGFGEPNVGSDLASLSTPTHSCSTSSAGCTTAGRRR